MESFPVYLDHLATTPPDPRVVDEVLPYLGSRFGNPSSRTHRHGWDAAEAVESARRRVAQWLDTEPEHIVFTSGATEANNLALRGLLRSAGIRRIVTQPTEHRAVLDVVAALALEVHWLSVDSDGRVEEASLDAARLRSSDLISVMAANNETGTLQPIAEVVARAQAVGAWTHVDAAQHAGRLPLSLQDWRIDLCSVSAHKIHGLPGCGGLVLSERALEVGLEPQLRGGGQERGLRAGTSNVPAIVGFGAAAALAASEWRGDAERIGTLRNRFEATLRSRCGARVHGDRTERIPHASNLALPGLDAAMVLMATPAISASLGSACTSSGSGSHVLSAMGLAPEEMSSTLRFGFGRFTTDEEIDRALDALLATARDLGHEATPFRR